MKKLFLLLSFLTIIYSAKAQYVTIPDAHFVTFLQTNFPGCMVGNQMDTTCAAITNATTLNCANDSIGDLTGVQYFDNLHTLLCSYNLLTSLPNLPSTLITLGCDNNYQLNSLPTLPSSLQSLNCNSNYNLYSLPALPNNLTTLKCIGTHISSLPSLPNALLILACSGTYLSTLPLLPNSIWYLSCGGNQFTTLPSLPSSLTYFACGSSPIVSLPTLPNSLRSLYCSYDSLITLPAFPPSLDTIDLRWNRITSLPTLPNAIYYLECEHNNLTSLPALPNSLTILWCQNNFITNLPAFPTSIITYAGSYNQLTSLPSLPNSLKQLYCAHNLLSSLPSLPNSLQSLICFNNQLTTLPNLPQGLNTLICDSNSISCFPVFPNSLINPSYLGFSISNNPFTCLPNYVPAMTAKYLSYPLCLTGNSNGCSLAQGVLGYTYKDNNANCNYNSWEIKYSNIHEKLYDSVGTLIGQTFSAMNGVYDFPQPTGTYTVKIDTAGYPYTVQCVHPGIDSTVVLTAGAALQTNVNFDIACKPGFDVGAQSIVKWGHIFPGQVFNIRCIAGDLSNWFGLHCALGISGQVIVTITGPVTYMNSLAGTLTPSVAGNVFTYNVANFGTISSSTAFGLVFTTNANAQNGDVICVNVTVTPTAGDNNTSNNTFNYCYTVVNSFDPNYKETYPEQVAPGFSDYFYYTVHFQNTGTAPAININLQDTLDANLDLNTFQVINYSHYCTSLLNGNRLSFNFPNIQLPDSSSNFDGSQGYVQYRIKPLANLPAGTLIHNKTSIYFDFNAPVVTNTTTNEFMLGIGVNEMVKEIGDLIIYPNPFTEETTITFAEPQKNTVIKITEVTGRVIRNYELGIRNGKSITIDMRDVAKGIYIVRIEDENKNVVNRKIVLQ